MNLNKQFLDAVKPAIYSTWGQIAADAMVEDNHEAIELVLDADRLSYAGFDHADSLVKKAIEENGWTPVCVMLSAHIALA